MLHLVEVRYDNIASITATPFLIQDNLLDRYADVFDEEVGCIAENIHLELNSAVSPFKVPARRLLVAIKDEVKNELDRLESMGIIAKITQPTDLVSALVAERKPNGKLRLCLDPQQLNKALKRPTYPVPVVDDFLPDLCNAKIFTVCDARNGFWQLALDEESSVLTTMATPFGRYLWRRLPFGLAPAPELFQEKMDGVVAGLDGVYVIFDDILVVGHGSTDEEAEVVHDARLARLMERCRERRLKLHPAKIRFKKSEVPYVGHRLTAKGLCADESKVRAILRMPEPSNVHEVRQFVGMANFFSRFIPHLSSVLEPLHQLTAKETAWGWGPEQFRAVSDVKTALASAPVLCFFDKNVPVTVQCDASAYGLGAVLLQREHPVAFVSRSLTCTEQEYAQIERELLAIVFALGKFDQYAYGRKVIVHTDHKPLETIFKLCLADTPRRLQRMLLQLQRYDTDVRYVPGRLVPVADALSRAPTLACNKVEDATYVHQTGFEAELEHTPAAGDQDMSDPLLVKIKQHREGDSTPQELREVIKCGWPEHQSKVSMALRPFFHYRDELTEEKGVLYKGNQCMVPVSLRQEVLKRLHEAHMGIEA